MLIRLTKSASKHSIRREDFMKPVFKKISKINTPLFAFILGLLPMFAIQTFAEGGATGAIGYYMVYNRDYANRSFVYAGYYNNVAYADADKSTN